jgi:hypothetical protein
VESFIGEEGQVLNYLFHLGGGATAWDVSRRGNHGLMIGALFEPSPWGWGARFRVGFNDYISVPDSPSLRLAVPFTLEAWVLKAGTYWQSILNKSDPASSNRGYCMRVSDANALQLIWGDGATVHYWWAGTVPTNAWAYLATVYDGSNIIIQVNENQWINSVGAYGISHDSSPLYIGRAMTGDFAYYKGMIGSIRLYSGRALTFTERLKHYYSWLPMIT